MTSVNVDGYQQLLRGTPGTLRIDWYDADDPGAPGTVTLAIARADGTTLTPVAAVVTVDNTSTVALSKTETGNLDRLTLTWTSTTYGTATTYAEIVGAHLFTLAAARAFEGGVMRDETKYPDSLIESARAMILDEFEEIAEVSFVPRYRFDTLVGDGGAAIRLGYKPFRALRSAALRGFGGSTWTAFTADELADVYGTPAGVLVRESRGYFTAGVNGIPNIRIGYEYGYDAPPQMIREAALMALRYYLVETNWSDRTISISTDTGSAQYWTPNLSGRGSAVHPLPEVDRRLRLFGRQMQVIA